MIDWRQLALVLARGLSSSQKNELALRLLDGDAARIGTRLNNVEWPSRARVNDVALRLSDSDFRLWWRGAPDYRRLPASLMTSPLAPAWVFIAGDELRLCRPRVAVIGSRKITAGFARATNKLACELSASGVAVVSGLAPGADSAAHAGAVRDPRGAGTIALPAAGVLKTAGLPALLAGGRATAVGLGSPAAPFNPGQAIARNRIVAELADVLVLVASNLKGGSIYAVRHALERRIPVFCFEAAGHTPPGNAALLSRGDAHPLPLDASPAQWRESILSAIDQSAEAKRIASVAPTLRTQLSLPV